MAKRRVASRESDSESPGSDYALVKSTVKASRKRQKRTTTKPGISGPSCEEYSPHGASVHQIRFPGEICTSLLKWYHIVSASRGMPWRKPYDPSLDKDARSQRAYEVWVSEIMLQQTQVATVIPYYNRWMAKFPTIRDLAAASIDDVNSLWKGLGYYSRASRLLAGAQKVVNDLDGRLPDNAKDMETKIPGIGRYSAGAICSIAYGEAVPVLDGNVHRLLSRFLALHAQPKAKATLGILWSAAQAIVHGVIPPQEANHSTTNDGDATGARSPENLAIGYPGDVNQALIELGSTVCKVRDPNCEVCPLRNRCTAYLWSENSKTSSTDVPDIEEVCSMCEPVELGGGVLAYPMKAERKKVREEVDFVSVVEWRSKVQQRLFLLVKRPENGLLAGLHEFPTSANVSASTSEETSIEVANSLLSTYLDSQIHPHPLSDASDTSGYHVLHVKAAGEVLHVFSHIRKTYRVQWVLLEGRDRPPMVAASFDDPPSASKGVSKRRKTPRSTQRDSGAVWLELDQVAEANIGTGVRKVWDLAKKLWE